MLTQAKRIYLYLRVLSCKKSSFFHEILFACDEMALFTNCIDAFNIALSHAAS